MNASLASKQALLAIPVGAHAQARVKPDLRRPLQYITRFTDVVLHVDGVKIEPAPVKRRRHLQYATDILGNCCEHAHGGERQLKAVFCNPEHARETLYQVLQRHDFVTRQKDGLGLYGGCRTRGKKCIADVVDVDHVAVTRAGSNQWKAVSYTHLKLP